MSDEYCTRCERPFSVTEVNMLRDYEKQKKETMRFQAAVSAMSALISAGATNFEKCASDAVLHGDALLAELEK